MPLPRKGGTGGAVHHICEIQLQHALLAGARRAAHKHYDTIRTRLAVSMPIQEHDNAQAYAHAYPMENILSWYLVCMKDERKISPTHMFLRT